MRHSSHPIPMYSTVVLQDCGRSEKCLLPSATVAVLRSWCDILLTGLWRCCCKHTYYATSCMKIYMKIVGSMHCLAIIINDYRTV